MENELYRALEKAKNYDELSFIYKDGTLHCSFCGKRQEDVKKVIAGKGVYICNECVELCAEILCDEEISKLE